MSTTFAPGERVVWNDDEARIRALTKNMKRLYGLGPFTILRVHAEDADEQRGTLHPQVVMIKELAGFTYNDPVLGRGTTEGVFSGAYFKPA